MTRPICFIFFSLANIPGRCLLQKVQVFFFLYFSGLMAACGWKWYIISTLNARIYYFIIAVLQIWFINLWWLWWNIPISSFFIKDITKKVSSILNLGGFNCGFACPLLVLHRLSALWWLSHTCIQLSQHAFAETLKKIKKVCFSYLTRHDLKVFYFEIQIYCYWKLISVPSSTTEWENVQYEKLCTQPAKLSGIGFSPSTSQSLIEPSGSTLKRTFVINGISLI